MALTTIYVVRHGFRGNWTLDTDTGQYHAPIRSPTGIPSDPALAAHGIEQAQQLAVSLRRIDNPPICRVYSSPFYRCLQTLQPYIETLPADSTTPPPLVRMEPGLGEWYGRARFDHPSPASKDILRNFFPWIDEAWKRPLIVPASSGETIEELQNRVVYAMTRLIAEEDAKTDAVPGHDRAILICTHAAGMIAIGRALTGQVPADLTEDDFKTYTAGISRFTRRSTAAKSVHEEIPDWSPGDAVPVMSGWQNGKGVGGGWDCVTNSDCSHLKCGAERGWHFAGDESFNASNLLGKPLAGPGSPSTESKL